jgi:hypothetical protein
MNGEGGSGGLMALAGLACVACCTAPFLALFGTGAAALGGWLLGGLALAGFVVSLGAGLWVVRQLTKPQSCETSCRIDGSCCGTGRQA